MSLSLSTSVSPNNHIQTLLCTLRNFYLTVRVMFISYKIQPIMLSSLIKYTTYHMLKNRNTQHTFLREWFITSSKKGIQLDILTIHLCRQHVSFWTRAMFHSWFSTSLDSHPVYGGSIPDGTASMLVMAELKRPIYIQTCVA